jgi:hypothetical protein
MVYILIMKKNLFFTMAILLVSLLSFTCKSNPAAAASETEARDPNMPGWVTELPPEDMIWGVGSALEEKQSFALQTAEKRGKTSIARLLKTYMQSLFIDYGKIENGKPLSEILQEDINPAIANMPLNEAAANLRWKAPNGSWWYRLEYSKIDARSALSHLFDEEAEKFPEFNVTTAMQLLEIQLARIDIPLQTNEDE